jgi:hypothetical protein
MNKKIDNAYLNQYTDNAIKRGYEIYDEWIDQKYGSRKIVASARGTVTLFKKRKNMAAFINALAHVFALDTRIKEKYNNILRCLFSYFSWHRETRALCTLKTELNLPLGETDIRNLIAVEIEKLAEKIENGWEEDGDDEAHGGKRNGKAEEEATTEEKEAEAAEKEPEAEELADKEETEKGSEEKEELPIEEAQQEEAKEEIGEKKETAEPQQKEDEKTVTDEKVEFAQEKNENPKEENNGPDEASEPSTDKKEEAKSYNDAVDSPPLYEESAGERSAEKTSLIDEMIIDNMVKGDKNIIGYQRIDEAERNKEADIPHDTVASQNEKNKSTDKDAYFYDKMIATDKGEAQQTINAESTKQDEKTSETKTEQPKETIQKNDNVQSNEREFKTLSEILQADLNESLENKVIKELGNTMSDESREAFAQMQMDVAREKLSIAYAELGIDEPAEIIGMQEPVQASRQNISPQRK